MTTNWEQLRDHIGKKLAGVGKIIFDVVVLFVLAGGVILEDLGTECLFRHLESGHLLTKGYIIIVEILLDLSALTVVASWLKDDLKDLFK